MHELTPLLARIRADEIERTTTRHAERPRIDERLRRRTAWRRVR